MKASEIRNVILGRAKPSLRRVGELEGVGAVYVRTATVAERNELMRLGEVKAGADGQVSVPNPDKFAALCVTRLAVDAEGARIFADADLEAVMGLQVDDAYWGLVSQAALNALNPDAKKLEESKGN